MNTIVNLLKATVIVFAISLFLFLFAPLPCFSSNIFELDEVSLNYKNYALVNDKARNLLLYPEFPKEGLNLKLNNTVLSYGYSNFRVESLTTDAQYRSIGLQVHLGIRIFRFLDVGFFHHSQHLLDRDISTLPKFPSEDALEMNLYFYRNDKKDSIF